MEKHAIAPERVAHESVACWRYRIVFVCIRMLRQRREPVLAHPAPRRVWSELRRSGSCAP